MDLYLIVCISAHAAPQTFSFYASGNLHDLSQAAYLPTDRENQPAGSIPAGCVLFSLPCSLPSAVSPAEDAMTPGRYRRTREGRQGQGYHSWHMARSSAVRNSQKGCRESRSRCSWGVCAPLPQGASATMSMSGIAPAITPVSAQLLTRSVFSGRPVRRRYTR